jgi:hypothetical protein
MKSSISRSAALHFTMRNRPPHEVAAALDDKTEAVIPKLEKPVCE